MLLKHGPIQQDIEFKSVVINVQHGWDFHLTKNTLYAVGHLLKYFREKWLFNSIELYICVIYVYIPIVQNYNVISITCMISYRHCTRKYIVLVLHDIELAVAMTICIFHLDTPPHVSTQSTRFHRISSAILKNISIKENVIEIFKS